MTPDRRKQQVKTATQSGTSRAISVVLLLIFALSFQHPWCHHENGRVTPRHNIASYAVEDAYMPRKWVRISISPWSAFMWNAGEGIVIRSDVLPATNAGDSVLSRQVATNFSLLLLYTQTSSSDT